MEMLENVALFTAVICPKCGGFTKHIPHKASEAINDSSKFYCAACGITYTFFAISQIRAAELKDEAETGRAHLFISEISCPRCHVPRRIVGSMVEKCLHCGDDPYDGSEE